MTNRKSFAFPSQGQQRALCEALAGAPAVPEAEATGGEGTAGKEDASADTLEGGDSGLKQLSVIRRQQVWEKEAVCVRGYWEEEGGRERMQAIRK